MQKEFLDISGSEFVLINKVGVGAVNGLNSCQVAGWCPESRRGPAEYRTDRTEPPPKLSPVEDPVTATAETCCPPKCSALHTFLGEASSGQACLALARDLQSDMSWDGGRGNKWMVESG